MTRTKPRTKYNVYVNNKGELVEYTKKSRDEIEKMNEELIKKGYKCEFLY